MGCLKYKGYHRRRAISGLLAGLKLQTSLLKSTTELNFVQKPMHNYDKK